MALPGTIVINGLTLDGVDDTNVAWEYQPETVNAALAPGRSTYGTAQNPGVPSTVSPKQLWVLNGVLVPTATVATLKGMIENNAVVTYSFTDNLWNTLVTGSSYSTTVRLIVEGQWLDRVYSEGDVTNQFSVSFAAWEV